MWVAGVVTVLVFGVVQGHDKQDPMVSTKQGLIRGLRANDGDYSMFLGIPYAIVNKDNPFGDAIPQPKFEDVFQAFDDSAMCPHVEEFNYTIVGNLDCLHLHVYVPNTASSQNRLPVLVWIHGGGFYYGYSNRYLYGPRFLVKHDVIFVTLNYRLGAYGFMCLDTPEVPGNQGLKDQALAMRWVKENIASFGGDVNKITAMGESAGAASVEYHLYSNNEELFNQAIVQSGSVFGGWSFEKSDVTAPLKLAGQIGFKTDQMSEALDFLKGVDTKLVVAATQELGLRFRICAEKEMDGVKSFLNDHPINVNVTKVRNIPILSGFNSREEFMTYGNKSAEFFDNLNVFDDGLTEAFDYDEGFAKMVDLVRHFYIGDEEIDVDVKDSLIDFRSDIRFNYPVQKSIKKFLEDGAKNVFQYVFSYNGQRNYMKQKWNITDYGAAHEDEIGYLFDFYDKSTPTDDDQRMIDRITTLWTNFVKYGDPTPETTELLPVKWIPITKDTYHYLDIDRELKMKRRPYHDRMAFWELFFKVNKEKIKGYLGN